MRVDEIVDAYASGASIGKIALRSGRTRAWVKSHLERNAVDTQSRPANGEGPTKRELAAELLRAGGMTRRAIAERLGVSMSTVDLAACDVRKAAQ